MFATLNITTMTNNKCEEFIAEQQELANIAKVLSHPARIAIIQLLAEKREIKTGNISDDLPISRTTVSQHLKALKEMGIINGTIDGLKIHYCLDMVRLDQMKKAYNKFFDSTISSFLCECDCK
jgi:ArsR family transcriptional regulator, arsenate/arsenite/antimonite-responsive transcriptional repressor